MAYKAGGIAVFGLLYMITNLCFAQELVVSPQNTTVFLDQLPSPLFTCVTRGGLPGWWVDGVPYEELSNEIRNEIQSSEEITDEGNTALTLTIPAIAKYNGTMIQCRLFSFTGSLADESENVRLLIKSVPVFTLNSENKVAFIPIIMNVRFSLDVTSAGPKVRYGYNVTGQNHQIIFCVGCTTETYPYTLNITQPCNQYTFMSDEGTTNATGYVLNATVIEPGIEAISYNVSRVIFGALDDSIAGCHYEIERMTNCVVSSSSDQQNYLDFCANEYYTIGVSITDDAGGSAQTMLQFSTFDVQEVQTTTDSNGLIQVTGEFLTNSTARGMFIVLESEDGSPDVFRALLRQDPGPLLTSTIVNVLPSTYNLFAYDLEENLEVGTSVAYPQIYRENSHRTTSVAELVSTPTFAFLKYATIDVTGSTIRTVCEFKEGTEGASCVLVYRQYGNETLVVVKNSQQNNAEMIVTITDPNNFTFAVFGKNSSYFNEQPFVMWPTIVSDIGKSTPSVNVPGVVISVILMITGLLLIYIVVIAAVNYRYSRWIKIPYKDYSEPEVLSTSKKNEYMMKQLESFAVQWKRIAKFMRLDRQKIQQIATTNGTNQECLQLCIDTWINSDKTKPSPISSLLHMLMLEMNYFFRQWREIAEKMEIEPRHINKIASYNWTDEQRLHRCVIIWVTEMSPSAEKYSEIYSELVMPKLRSFAVQWRRIAETMRFQQINHIAHIKGTNEERLRRCVRMWVTGSQSNPSPITSFIKLLKLELEYFAGQWSEITEKVGFSEEQVYNIIQHCKTDKERLQHCVKMWVTEFEPSPDQFADVYSDLMKSKMCSFLVLWKQIAEAMELTKEEIDEIEATQTDTSGYLKQCVQKWATGPQVKPSPYRAFLGILDFELKYFSLQWKQMARTMGIEDDEISEIDVNSRTDELCVEKCVDIWITELEPSPEKFAEVYSDIFVSQLRGFAFEWKTIAKRMGFEKSSVDNIASQYGTDEQCLRDCLNTWAKGSQEGSPFNSFTSILMSKLEGFASQWKKIANLMNIDMSRVNKKFDGNETDKDRLLCCIEIWCNSTGMKPSLTKLSSILDTLKNHGGGLPGHSI